jgi:hypothetical protein
VLASDPSDSRITPPSLLSLSSPGSPVILTPQPRHPVETVQRLLHRYLAGPPSPERSYEARREEALVNYQARLAAVPPAVTQPDREQTTFDVSGSHLQPAELPYQSASDIVHHGAVAVQHQRQHAPAVGRGIFIPSSVDAIGHDNLDPSGPPRKPTIMACLFCRGRKIACNAPPPGSADRTCTFVPSSFLPEIFLIIDAVNVRSATSHAFTQPSAAEARSARHLRRRILNRLCLLVRKARPIGSGFQNGLGNRRSSIRPTSHAVSLPFVHLYLLSSLSLIPCSPLL